jgi:hypothetical protein
MLVRAAGDGVGLRKGVDGGPSPAMTGIGGAVLPLAR